MQSVSPQSRAWVVNTIKGSKKSIIGILVVILVSIIIGYTFKPPVPVPTVRYAKTSKIVSWASSKASCDSGTPSSLTAFNATHYVRECICTVALSVGTCSLVLPTVTAAQSRRRITQLIISNACNIYVCRRTSAHPRSWTETQRLRWPSLLLALCSWSPTTSQTSPCCLQRSCY